MEYFLTRESPATCSGIAIKWSHWLLTAPSCIARNAEGNAKTSLLHNAVKEPGGSFTLSFSSKNVTYVRKMLMIFQP